MEIVKPSDAAEAANYNEATVRFRIINPILTSLGYKDGDEVYLHLEEKLEYPYIHIGRKSKKDVPVGYPDYRAGLKGARGSFIVEAKAGGVQISDSDIEQAHSYAAHAQVGANYFVLCNGIEFRIYETLSGPKPAPLVIIPVSEVNHRYHEIENILSPDRMEINCKVKYDMRLKLCNGVGSSVRVRSGAYKMSSYEYKIFLNGVDQTEFLRKTLPKMEAMEGEMELLKNALQLRVDKGSIYRDDDGRICAWAHLAGATVQNYEGMKLLGVDKIVLATDSEFLSTDSESPTIFESVKDFMVEKGAMMPNLFSGFSQVEGDLTGGVFIKFAMYLDGHLLKGQYIAFADYNTKLPGIGHMKAELDFAGGFQMEIDE